MRCMSCLVRLIDRGEVGGDGCGDGSALVAAHDAAGLIHQRQVFVQRDGGGECAAVGLVEGACGWYRSTPGRRPIGLATAPQPPMLQAAQGREHECRQAAAKSAAAATTSTYIRTSGNGGG